MARILLIDDDGSILRSLAIVLEADGHEIIPIRDSEQGLELVKAGDYDLLITDIRMTPVDGMEILRVAHQVQPTKPTIIISAYSSDSTVERGITLGCSAYIKKPFKVQEIYDAVSKALTPPA